MPIPRTEKVNDIIYHFMPSTWKNEVIDQGFNNAVCTIKEMTGFFESREESLEPKQVK